MLRIEMLPAAHGDALFVEWGNPDRPHRMLVDGGPFYAYGALRERLLRIPVGQRHLDLLVITHIDADHIEGVLRLLLDEALGVTYGDIWFNDWVKLEQVPRDALGAIHGEFVGALLEEHDLPWNRAFGGGPAGLTADGEPRRLAPLPGGLQVTLLSPGPTQLNKLRKAWRKTLGAVDFTPGDRAEALEQLRTKARYAPPEDQLGLKRDTSAANGSSLAFLIEHDGKRALLAGDAFPEVVDAALAKLGDRVPVDVLKLSHHGSFSSSSRSLLERLQAGRYLISTSGARYAHPDPETLALILAAGGRKPRVVFNYHGKNVAPWVAAAAEGKIDAEFPAGVQLEL